MNKILYSQKCGLNTYYMLMQAIFLANFLYFGVEGVENKYRRNPVTFFFLNQGKADLEENVRWAIKGRPLRIA